MFVRIHVRYVHITVDISMATIDFYWCVSAGGQVALHSAAMLARLKEEGWDLGIILYDTVL